MALLIFLILFPSVTFGIVNAEIFPWAIIAFLVFGKGLPKGVFWVIIFLLFNAILTAIIFDTISESIRSFFAYFNALLSFCIAYKLSRISALRFYRLFRLTFIALLLLGIFQYFGLLSWLDDPIKFLIPRGSMVARTDVNRGVSLLSTEPARAGSSLVLMYILIVHKVRIKHKFFYDLLMLIYLLVFIQSSMALILYALYLILTYRFYTLLVLPAFTLFYALLTLYEVKGRSLIMLEDLLVSNSLGDAFYLLVSTSGNRAISIYAAWKYACTNFLGGGVGNWVHSSLVALKSTNYDFSTIPYYVVLGDGNAISGRVSGFFSNILLDTGLIGFVVVLFTFIVLYKKSSRNLSVSLSLLLLLIFIKLLFLGSPGHPLPWFIIGLVLNPAATLDLNSVLMSRKKL